MTVVAAAYQKGAVGKTATAINVGMPLAERRADASCVPTQIRQPR